MGWIDLVMEAAGFYAAYDIEFRSQPHCVFRVYKDLDIARGFEGRAWLPAKPSVRTRSE